MNRKECKTLTDKLSALIDTADFGDFKVTVGNASFSAEGHATIKVNAAKVIGGVAQTPESADFKLFATEFGLKPENLGQRFKTPSGKPFVITGLKRRSRKRPITAKSLADGRTYLFPADMVARSFQLAAGTVGRARQAELMN